jgi:hypothetical protein
VLRWNLAHCVAHWPCRDLRHYGYEVRPGIYSVDLGVVLGHHPRRFVESSLDPENRPGR